MLPYKSWGCSVMKQLLIRWIQFYQRRISPHKKPCCRFYPSCSQYAYLAIQKYGAFRGGIKAIWNFAHVDVNVPEGIQVENVHLSDSLMKLSYNFSRYKKEKEGE